MGILKDCINKKKIDSTPVWFMRQAGRYLPEFREIRSKNTDFINLCLNPELSKEITLQPLKRFKIDAAIIFSDILLIPYALGQELKFVKNLGPQLGELNIERIINTSDNEIQNKLNPVYQLINITSKDSTMNNKDLIGFIGATWTLFVYMLNRTSPKKKVDENIFNNPDQKKIFKKIIATQKLHIKNQIDNGASLIQIFDSWAGLLTEDKYEKYIYQPTIELVEYVKSLGVEVICFPRGIKSYKEFCDIVKPSAINIDYETDPKNIADNINIPIQGGMNPAHLLLEEDKMLRSARNYLEIFRNHNYIFNLGHGVVPETNPETIKKLVDFVKGYK
tara:strand:- start:1457 stop:2458 length:1002 start_codon:yes stop_codon:yes gene_type:complete